MKNGSIIIITVLGFLIFSYAYGAFALGFLEPYPRSCMWATHFIPIQITKFFNDIWVLPQPIICVG